MIYNKDKCNQYTYRGGCVYQCCCCECNPCREGPPGPPGPQGPAGAEGPQGDIGPAGPTGQIGPTGQQGEPGADGLVGTIRGVASTVADLPATGVLPGDIYYVEEDGSIYLYSDGTWTQLSILQGPRGPEGPQGPIGPEGPQGEDGIIGTITGVVETAADLPDSSVAPGSIYYVIDTGLTYLYTADDGWTELNIVQGPRGPEGPQGEQGVDGTIGTISGTVPTFADLPTTGITTGEIYYVEETETIYLFNNEGEWIELSPIQGPRGPEGPQGEQGPAGANGTIGTITGVVENISDLPTTGVSQGDIYYVTSVEELYVWDEESRWVNLAIAQGPAGIQGPQGEQGIQGEEGEQGIQGEEGVQGPTGPAASSYMIIPFATGEAPMSFITNGQPSRVSLIGFGYGDRRNFGLLDAANYSIVIDPSDQSFSITNNAGNSNKQIAFTLPFDASIRSIYTTVGNYGDFTFEYPLYPYIQLYQAPAGSNNFTRIDGALAMPDEPIGPGDGMPADIMRSGRTIGLDIKLTAGTRVAIGALLQSPGHIGAERSFWLYYTGGIGLSYDGE